MKEKFNVVKMIFGSKLYGTATENSDTDYQAVFKPSLREVILNSYVPAYKINTSDENEKNTVNDVDISVTSLQKFLLHAYNGETFVLDMLHSREWIYGSDEWEFLHNNRSKFYTKNMKSYLGYVKHQAAKYGIRGSRLETVESAIMLIKEKVPAKDIDKSRLRDVFHDVDIKTLTTPFKYVGEDSHNTPMVEIVSKKFNTSTPLPLVLNSLGQYLTTYGHRAKLAKENNGIDWKALHHALRVGYQMKSIYENGDFEYPLNETDFLMKVKLGELDYTTVVAPTLENLVEEIEQLAYNSDYPDEVNREFFDDWLVWLYEKA